MAALQEKKMYLFGIGIGGIIQNDYHQYKIRLTRRLTQTLVFPKLSYNVLSCIIMYYAYNTCLRFWEKEIWYHEKCTQRTFTVSKAITN